ncbi:MAG TPA: O-antigen ligase family protein, partial [Dongiaceae bacterium]|nr:O-antigen ligase family protein [Dongiaceae bacterium]
GLLGFSAALQFSIAAAEILFALTVLAWLGSLYVHRERPEVPPWFLPLAVYAGITLLSTALSMNPRVSLGAAKQLVLYLVVPIVFRAARGRRANTVMQVILTVGAVSAIVGVAEYGIFGFDNLHNRPRGTLGHYMTYSGLLMMVMCSAAARLLFERRDRIWPALIMPALIVAVVLTFSRNAWVGGCVGIGVLLILKDFRLLALAPVAAGLFFALAPSAIVTRLYSTFDLRDPTVRDRVAMYQAGIRIVEDHPLLGTGPNMVQRVYPSYRQPTAVEPTPPHLHDVPLQIAAERGVPALIAWLWFLVTVTLGLLQKLRRDRPRYLAAAGIGVIAAMIGAGFFEYNFGDSEFLMLF